MRKILLALTTVLMSATAQAGSLTCDAPRLIIGREDGNPVVATDVEYNSGDWRVLHHLASGAVVARHDQYNMLNESRGDVTRWAGQWSKNRAIVMVGTAWADTKTGEGGYEEKTYDTAHGNRVTMHSVTRCQINLGQYSLNAAPSATRQPDIVIADQMYQVPLDISSGRLNIRNGPGVNYALVGAIPAGTRLRGKPPLQCRPREDGVRGADWCHVSWNGYDGWVSQAGLMPIREQ